MSGHVLDGIFLSLDPTEFGWVPRQRIGEDGYGNAVYIPVRSYFMKWGLMNTAQWEQIFDVFQNARGERVTCTLVEIDGNPYAWENYSGCVIDEPEYSKYFTEHYQNVSILVRGITTEII